MSEKQQQLTFDKGITNVPSDAMCSDNCLSECVGMVYDNGEHKPIQHPSVYMLGLSVRVIYVHEYNDQKRFIVMDRTGEHSYSIKWGTKNENGGYFEPYDENLLTTSEVPKVTSIGKTLIITSNKGMNMFVWKNVDNTDTYLSLTVPFPEIRSELKMEMPSIPIVVGNSGKCEDIIMLNGQHKEIVSGQQESYNNLVVGLYSKNKKIAASRKLFTKPFFARLALEMYDGTYTYIKNPVLLFPSMTKNTCGFFYGDNKSLYLRTFASNLLVSQETDYSDYSDIIKDVVLFVSKGIEIYNTNEDQPISYLGDATRGENPIVGDGIAADGIERTDHSYVKKYTAWIDPSNWGADSPDSIAYGCLKERDIDDIKYGIDNETVFYKLCSLGTKPTHGFVDVRDLAPGYVFENITTQEQLGDDYFSRNMLFPKTTYVYNSRLNIANVSRGVFPGYSFFMPLDSLDSETSVWNYYDFYVKIDLDTKDVWVATTLVYTNQKQGIYFFYPDNRAKHVTIYRREEWGATPECICDEELRESTGLNGAYFFRDIPSRWLTPDEQGHILIERVIDVGEEGFHITSWTKDGQTMPPDVYNNGAKELLPNYILQSEVNNPFVFKAKGYFKVGTGKIVAMSSITQALSEGQFGQFPLLVFSESGIWALSVADTGYYSSIQPISREVPLLGNPCIKQTDGAVFFASKKGLMMIVGSQVKCVSEQLSGRSSESFVSQLENAVVAYDYRNSMLLIFPADTEKDIWAYSIQSGTFSHYQKNFVYQDDANVVSCYPDDLIQGSGKLYSLLERPNINDDPNTYTAVMETRPMKLENALALKSIMQIRHILQFHPYTVDGEEKKGTMTLHIFASNNLDNWVELHSLRGTPWKYYKFRYVFSGLKATDRFAGTMLITQERRTNKLR